MSQPVTTTTTTTSSSSEFISASALIPVEEIIPFMYYN